MQIKNSFSVILLLGSFLVWAGCSPPKPSTPAITLSGTRIPASGSVDVRGEGFTPLADIQSHLRRPDGTEFPVLAMRTDAQGEFTHLIETWLLQVGTHELWVIDSTTGVSSNVAKFEVTLEQPPASQ